MRSLLNIKMGHRVMVWVTKMELGTGLGMELDPSSGCLVDTLCNSVVLSGSLHIC